MGTRKHKTVRPRSKKSKQRTTRRSRVRSKRQTGRGTICSRPGCPRPRPGFNDIVVSDIDTAFVNPGTANPFPGDAYLTFRKKVNDGLEAAIIAMDADGVKNYLSRGADSTTLVADMNLNLPEWMREQGGDLVSGIIYAARHIKDITIMEHLFKARGDRVMYFPHDSTPLTEAVEWGNLSAAEFLLKNKAADVNASSRSKPPALGYAVMREDIPMIYLLLSERKGGIDFNYTANNTSYNFLDDAESGEDPRVLDILRGYVREQITMSEEDFATCEKSDGSDGKNVECGISLEPIDRTQAVAPPPGNNGVCFNRTNLQKWLRINKTNPITNTGVSEEWIKKWYPLGLGEEANYDKIYDSGEEAAQGADANVGGRRASKRASTRKH